MMLKPFDQQMQQKYWELYHNKIKKQNTRGDKKLGHMLSSKMVQLNHCQRNWPYGHLHIERKQEGEEYLEKKM
jgi:hypothetical protein